MGRKLIKIEGFDARDYGDKVVIYPHPRDRWVEVTVRKPLRKVLLRTGRPGLVLATIEYSHTRSATNTLKRAVQYGRAIVAAALYVQDLNFEAKGTPK